MAETTTHGTIEEFRDALALLKRDTAKVLAEMQIGGDRSKRRELGRALEACKRRSKPVGRLAEGLLGEEGLTEEVRAELEQATAFLTQLQAFDARQSE